MMQRRKPRRSEIATWAPSRFMEDVNRFFDEPFMTPRMIWRRLPEEELSWAPSMDIYEKENSYVVRMELPGIKMEDVEISVSGDTLTVRGERKIPEDIEEEEYQTSEIFYGSFTRSVTLPEKVQADKINATFDDGILEIQIPKAEEEKPARIQIKAKETKRLKESSASTESKESKSSKSEK